MVILEAKLTRTPQAVEQLTELYAPLAEYITKKPLALIQVYRNSGGALGTVPNLEAAFRYSPLAPHVGDWFWRP